MNPAISKKTYRPALKVSMHITPEATPDELAFARQLGVDCVYTWIRDEQRTLAYLRELRHKVEDAGLCLYNVGNMTVGKSDKIHLALPGRDEVIADFCALIEALGAAGIGVTTFTWEPTQVWSTGRRPTRGGAEARYVDLAEMAARPYTHGRAYSQEEIWDNFSYLMERLIPVAEGAGVRLALHPNDPPAESLGGIPCLIHSAESYRKAFCVANSPALGMEFCAGCWLEGGDGFGDMLAGIREFVADDRILVFHFRNVSSPLPVFTETFLDDGYMDMYQVMRTLVETGYPGTVIYDHTPRFVGEYAAGGGPAFALGYMRALIERAMDECGAARG
jgi:mannonate dehydratase